MRVQNAVALVALLSAACDSGPLGTTSQLRSTIAVDLSTLGSAGGRLGATTVIESVNLVVSPAQAAERRYSRGVDANLQARFDVTAPAGTVDFTAEVVSNNGTLLHRGTATEEIAADGFTVTIDVLPVSAMMIVAPDTADLRNGGSLDITIRNPGVATLDWTSLTACDNTRCVVVVPKEDSIPPDGQQSITVRGFSLSQSDVVELVLSSNVGSVSIPVIPQVIQAGRLPTARIDSITETGSGNAVDPARVSGSIDVHLTVSVPPGTQAPLLSVVLGNTPVCSQEPTPGTGAFAAVVCTVDTGQFDQAAAFATGNAMGQLPNGRSTLSAELSSNRTILAADGMDVVLANQPFMLVRPTLPATCAGTPVWCAGSIALDVAGVRFSPDPGAALASVSVTVAGNVTASASDATPPFRIVFAAGPSPSGGIAGLEHGDVALTVGAVTAAGSEGPDCVVTAGPQLLNSDCTTTAGRVQLDQPLRIDNAAPRIGNFDLTPATLGCGRVPACWIGAAFAFSDRAGFFAASDGGVGGATVTFQAGPPKNLIPVRQGADLPESPVPSYVAAARVSDALGNATVMYASPNATQPSSGVAGAQRFGVDRTAPHLAIAGIANLSSNPPDSAWYAEFSDSGIGVSGFGATPVLTRLRRIRPTGSTCYVPDTPLSLTTVPCTTPSGAAAGVPDDGIVQIDRTFVPGASEGYWQTDMVAIDIAQNRSPLMSALTLIDVTAPTVGPVTAPSSIPGASSPTFSAPVTDNIDLVRIAPIVHYNGIGGFVTFEFNGTATGAYGWSDGFTSATTAVATVPGFVRAWQGTDHTGRVTGVVQPALQAGILAHDAAGSPGVNTTPILNAVLAGAGGSIPSLTSINPSTFVPSDPNHGLFLEQTPSNGILCVSVSGCANAASTVLQATMTGPNATFANPFSRVDFYYFDFLVGRWAFAGMAVPSASDNTVTSTRTWTYSTTWSVTGLTSADGRSILGNVAVLAMGVHPSGSAVIASTTLQSVTLSAH